jgi:hypothetical protein
LWPPRWIGELPPWEVDAEGARPLPDPALFGLVVTSAELPNGVAVRAFRDGMIAFRPKDEIVPPPLGESTTADDPFIEWVEQVARLANAHLACLAAVRCRQPVDTPGETASLWSVMQVDFESGEFRAANERLTGGTRVALWAARNEPVTDWRAYRQAAPITREQIEKSFALLGDLLALPSGDLALLRAEMLARAVDALHRRDWTGGLMNAWTACEGLLGKQFQDYLRSQAGRETAVDIYGNEHQFIENARQDWLTGSDVTVRHTVEFLSLLDQLPYPLYLACTACAKARNRWAHGEAVPSPEIAAQAVHLLGELFELVEGMPLQVFPDDLDSIIDG